MSDYDVTTQAPPPALPPLPPAVAPPPLPSPPGSLPATQPAPSGTNPPPAPPAAVATEFARPEVTLVKLSVRQVVFVDRPDGNEAYPKGTLEVAIGLEAVPDPDHPVSATLDRLNALALTKVRTYLDLMGVAS